MWIHLLVGLRHFPVGYQLKQLRTSVSSSWERKGGQTLPHMFYLATVLLLRVIDVSVEIISETRGPHHQPTDCTLLWRNANYSSSTSLFFSSCSFTVGCVIVHLHGELTDGTFTLPLRVCNSLLCWVEGGYLCSVHCSWPTTTFNLFSYVYHITILGALLEGGLGCIYILCPTSRGFQCKDSVRFSRTSTQ